MNIHHIALWTAHLDTLKCFYETYFQAQAGPKYTNPVKGFQSYFLSFGGGARLELMQMPGIAASTNSLEQQFTGLVHFAIAVPSQEEVDRLTAQLAEDGYRILSAPRRTGDGYYESLILDPDGNRVEITAA